MKPSRHGFTLMELLVATAIGGGVLGLAVLLLGRLSTSEQNSKNETQAQEEMLDLAQTILAFGRSADLCQRPCARSAVTGQTCELECVFDFGRVSFSSLNGNAGVHYEEQPTGGAWTTRRRFVAPFVRNLTVCGDVEFLAANCPIRIRAADRDVVELTHVNDLAAATPTPGGRYYRYLIRGALANGAPDKQLQSSFFVRNPLIGFSDPASLGGSLRVVKRP